MKMTKRVFSLVLALVMVLGQTGSAFAAGDGLQTAKQTGAVLQNDIADNGPGENVDADADEPEETEEFASPGAGQSGEDVTADEPEETEEKIAEDVPGEAAGEISEESAEDAVGEAELLGDEAENVVWVNYGTEDAQGFATLQEALASDTVADNSTLTLTGDLEISERIEMKSADNISITDDGEPHTLYFYNSDSSNGYGRGLQVGGEKTVTIRSSTAGNLTLVGHSPDGTVYNRGAILYVYRGTLVLDGVTIKECATKVDGAVTTYNGFYTSAASGKIYNYTGSAELNDCTITGCTTTDRDGGAAITNGGTLTLSGSTKITGNYATSSLSGGVLNVSASGTNSEGKTEALLGKTTVKGSVIITENLKNCSSLEDVGVAGDGDASDLASSDPGSIRFSDFSGTVGIDYAGDDSGYFGSCSGTCDLTGVTNNQDSTLVLAQSSSSLYWQHFCTITPGDLPKAGLSYSLAGTTVTLPGGTAGVLSLQVDEGYFTVSSTALSSVGSITSAQWLTADADGTLQVRALSESDSDTNNTSVNLQELFAASGETSVALQGLTLMADWSAETAQRFLQSVLFSVPASGMTQKICLSLLPEAPEGGIVLGGSTYQAITGNCSLSAAKTAAENAGGHPARITCGVENRLIAGLLTDAGENDAFRLGGELLSDNWYWNDGSRISVSSAGSTGWQGAYTNWKEGYPKASAGTCMAIGKDGCWTCIGTGSDAAAGWILEIEDANAATITTTRVSCDVKAPVLSSVSVSLQDNICLNAYLELPDTYVAEGSSARVTVTVGNQNPVTFSVSELEPSSVREGTYKVTVPVLPQNLNANVAFEFYNRYGNKGATLGSVESKSEDASDEARNGESESQYDEAEPRYSVVWYCESVLKGSGSSDLKTLITAMLNYGAAVEEELAATEAETAETTDSDASEWITSETYEDTSEGIDLTDSGDITGAILSSTSEDASYNIQLVVENGTVIRLRPEPETASDFAAELDGTPLTVKNDGDGAFVDIPVNLSKISRTCTVIFTGDFSDTLQINALGVIQGILQDNDATAARKKTADRLYKLSLAADAYFGVYTPAASTLEAVLNTGFAYLANGEAIQYDQRSMTNAFITDHANPRRQLDVSPSDATARNTVYLDCSSFCWNVYREVFGESALLSAFGLNSATDFKTSNLANLTASSEMFVKCFDDPASKDILSELRETLQPGDLLVRYTGSKSSGHGHVVLWTGTGYLHCTGASYDYDNGTDKTETGGAVYFVPQSRFNSGWYSGVDKVVVLRPLNVLGTADETDAGTARQQLGALSVTKTMTLSSGEPLVTGRSAAPGETVTVTLTVSNPALDGTMTADRRVCITDKLPKSVTFGRFTGRQGTCSGSTLCWKSVKVAAGATVTLSYTMTMPETSDTLKLTMPEANVTSVEAGSGAKAICAGCCDLSVEAQLTQDQKTALAAAVNELIAVSPDSDGAESNLSGGLETLNGVLADTFGEDVALCSNDEDWVNALFGTKTTKDGNYFYYVNISTDAAETAPAKYLVENFASGRRVLNYSYNNGRFDVNTRIRSLTTANLNVGDVLAVRVSGTSSILYRYYVYLGGDEMLYLTDDTAAKVSADEVLDNLLNKSCFAVFRLSCAADDALSIL